MPEPAFGLEDILSDAFAALKARFGAVVGGFVVFALIQAVCGKLPLLSLFVSPPMIAGYSLVLLKALRSENPGSSDLFKGFSFYIPVLAAGLLLSLLILLGLLCLVVPGVILGLMWSQTFFLLADDLRQGRPLSGWGAMQRSAALMSGHKLRFLGYTVVLAVIGLSGAVAAGLGLLITMPFAWLAGAAFYERLSRTA